jgi:glycosyltransferase involved in cell wall biosynthesis
VLNLRGFDLAAPSHIAELADVLVYERSASQYANTATLLSRLRSFRPDLVYVWYSLGIGGLALLDLLEVAGVPWVMHLMDCVPAHLLGGVVPAAGALFARENWSVFTRARIISMSEQIISEVAELTGIRFDHPPEIIPGWVDAAGLRQRQHFSEPRRTRFMTAGSIGKHKGTDIIVEACALLAAEGFTEFGVDVFCLSGTTGPEPWIALAAERGVSKLVQFRGGMPQPELLSLLPEYDAFLFPTQTREPFGFAPIEAAACGLVPIITRNAGVAERLIDGVHALKVDRTPISLAGAMRRLLTGEIDAAEMGRRAGRLVRNDLSLSRCLDQIERFLRGVATGWEQSNVDDPRLPAVLYAKHMLGLHLTAYP